MAELVQRCHAHNVPLRLLGGGSNLLVAQETLPGVVVRLSAPQFGTITVDQERLAVGAGAQLGHVVSTAAREGLGGLEALVGIPGTVGGALRGNASSQGADIGQRTSEVTVMTREGKVVCHGQDQLRFASGRSSLDELAILHAVFQLERRDPADVTRQMQKHWIVKRADEPIGDLGHGRIFIDPNGMVASQLIEHAGLRNASVGGARVSDRDANFIVVDASATSHDVLALIQQIQDEVETSLGVRLKLQLDVW